MQGYRRSDGFYELEARVTDRKPHAFTTPDGEAVPARQPIHDMGVRLVFDVDLVVHAVETFTDAAPYADCPEGGRALQALKGMKIGRGWSREVRSRLGGARSCTHLMELLIPMATAAYQSLTAVRRNEAERRDASGRPLKIDSCYAYAAHREIVLRRWPEFHRPELPPKEA